MRTLFYQLASRAGLQGPHVHPHTCRHTVVQRLWYAGNSLDRIARFLGHESPTTTGKYYLHLAHRELISHMVIPWHTLKDREDLPVDVRHHNHTQEHALGNKHAKNNRHAPKATKQCPWTARRCPRHPRCPAIRITGLRWPAPWAPDEVWV